MAEGSETPGGERGGGLEGRGSRSEGDLLSERRARRAAESGELALVRRAEAAEATVRTLEIHVATLQQRLQDAQEEQRRMAQLIEVEQASIDPRTPAVEQELRRAKQHEYAEQRLRVEAEDRCMGVERESRMEIDRLARHLGASEQRAQELASELERAQRRLAEAEQSAATEIAAARRTEQGFQARLTELEGRAVELQRGLDSERAARERSDRLLEGMRQGIRRVEGLVRELGAVIGRLRTAALRDPVLPDHPQAALRPPAGAFPPEPRPASAPAHRGPNRPEEVDRAEMTAALAAAVARLRARVEDLGEAGETGGAGEAGEAHAPSTAGREAVRGPAARPAAGPPPPLSEQAGREAVAGPADTPVASPARAPGHKHSMSLLTRLRIRRKDRRRRRSAAAEPPSMPSQ